MPDLTRLISGVMRLGNVLLAISDRCWIDHFVIGGSDSVQLIGESVMPAAELLFCFTSNRVEIHPCSNCRAPMTLVSSNSSRSNTDNVSIAIVLTGVRFLGSAQLFEIPKQGCRGEHCSMSVGAKHRLKRQQRLIKNA